MSVRSGFTVLQILIAMPLACEVHAAARRDSPHAVMPIVECASLKGADLSGSTDRPVHISDASEVEGAAAYCKIEGSVEPAVRFEVHLPLKGWTQRYLQLGCGGLCGTLKVELDDHARACMPAARGELALASTDMGHEGAMDGSWAAHNLQARIDFAYRGVHVTAQVAKALIARYYGRPPRYSYFDGCSDGGREALMEAQRYPKDFNGIAAGAAALNFSVQNSFYHAWNALSNTAADGSAILTAARLPILHDAALAVCDAEDGLKDGLISDPRRCNFDPAVAQCHDGQNTSHCLTAAEVEAARRIYAGAHDTTGNKLVISGPMPGSELSWTGVFVPRTADAAIFSALIATGSLKYLSYAQPLPESWTLRDLKFDQATLDGFQYRVLYDATNPDLSKFAAAGGHLLMWHGWSDPHISPLNSIAFYTAVQKELGLATTAKIARLFLFPGMYHCDGGDGLFRFDALTPLMAWTEHGTPPARLIASHVGQSGKVDRTRPVYAFPRVAHYRGRGSIDQAANFRPAEPKQPQPPEPVWLGAKYMVSGLQQPCEAQGAALTCGPSP